MLGAGWRRGWARAVVLLVGVCTAGEGAPQESELALAVLQEARALAARNELEPALEKTERALAFARAELGPYDALVGFILDDLASLNYRLGRLEEALAHAQGALPVLQAARGPASVGHALVAGNLASILSALGRDDEALPLLEAALPVLQADLGADHARTAALAQNLALVQARLDMVEAATTSFGVAIEGWERLGGRDDPRLVRALLGRADLGLRAGELDPALGDADRAGAILGEQETPSVDAVAAASLLRAEIVLRKGRPDDALVSLEAASARLASLGSRDHPAARRLLDRQATLHLLHGEHARAERLLAGLPAADLDGVARADRLARLAEARLGLGRLADAMSDLEAALDLLDAEPAAPPELLATVRRDLARLDLEAGRPGEARDRLDAMLPADGPHAGWTKALLGRAHRELGQPEAARAAFASALAQVPSGATLPCPEPSTVGVELAALDLADDDFAAAEARLEAAADAASPGGRAEVLLALADLALADGRSGEALGLIEATLDDVARPVRPDACAIGPLDPDADARRLLERALDGAAAATAAGRTAGDLGLMLEIAQHILLIDGRGVREAAAGALAAGDGASATLLRERRRIERAIRGRRSLLARHRLAPNLLPERREALAAEIRELDAAWLEADRRLRAEAPARTLLVVPEPAGLQAIQERLGARDAVLVQVTTDRLTHLFLIRRTSVAFAQTEVTAADLAAWVDAARRAIMADGAFDSFPLHALHAGLIAPFAASLAEVDLLLVLPDRAMHDLPFGLLVERPAEPVAAGGDFGALDFLIERLAIGVATQLGAVDLPAGRPPPRLPLVGLAAPPSGADPVPDARRESWLVALAGAVTDRVGDVVLDLQARQATLAAIGLDQFRAVALSMPSTARDHHPPALLPTSDGERLDAGSIARLGLVADMVVLGPDAAGRPARLLAPAFFVAGARSVVAPHWPALPAGAAAVGRAASMVAGEAALHPAEALRRAVLPLIDGDAGRDAAHPRVWGAFSAFSAGR